MKRLAMPVALAAVVGCSLLRRPPFLPGDQSDPVRMVASADQLARDRSAREARALYQKVLRQYPRTPAAADALYGLGQLFVQPDSALRDYAAAHAAFGRLLSDYPDSAHVLEARAWQAALGELLRNQADAKQVRDDLERLKQLDMEQERRR